jgi:allophanate hydrolase
MHLAETVASIVDSHRSGAAKPSDTLARCYDRIRAYADEALFIALRAEADAIAEVNALDGKSGDLPLYGVPVAVKDNIDVKGLPTTAACPAFSYHAKEDATAVARLRRAGAIVIGKTNLDQFATGLVGVRSPYGIPRNALDPKLIPGGSSSGSAVAVAAGLVPLALGTDTAGSGRVPAMLNNIVGLKPSLGLISTFGVVPACRTLDCVSIFALTTDDAWQALAVMAGRDARDPYSSNRAAGAISAMPPHIRLGIPRAGERIFFGDRRAAADYDDALARLARLGATLVEIDMAPLYETARLLYEGPWVAERYAAVRKVIESQPEVLHPVTREIIVSGAGPSAADAFTAFYRLEALRRAADTLFRQVDALALPTAPTCYTVDQVLADPITLNSRLGTYTNFVNLLDLCGLAVPAALHDGAAPFGITLLAPGGSDAMLASVGRVFHEDVALPLGGTGTPHPVLPGLAAGPAAGEVTLAVVGAHLSGMPLNGELRTCGARFLESTSTTRDYRLYALEGTNPPKPGMLRTASGAGASIAVETWALPAEGFGRFVAGLPSPMTIGTVVLEDGRAVKGFLVEPQAVAGARDISSFGGWRAYITEAQARQAHSEPA